jgi:hypothetical protein
MNPELGCHLRYHIPERNVLTVRLATHHTILSLYPHLKFRIP